MPYPLILNNLISVEKSKSAKSGAKDGASSATGTPSVGTTTGTSKAFAAPPETSKLISKYVSKVKTKVKRMSTLKIKVKSKSRSVREPGKSVSSGAAVSSSSSPGSTAAAGAQKSSKFALPVPAKSAPVPATSIKVVMGKSAPASVLGKSSRPSSVTPKYHPPPPQQPKHSFSSGGHKSGKPVLLPSAAANKSSTHKTSTQQQLPPRSTRTRSASSKQSSAGSKSMEKDRSNLYRCPESYTGEAAPNQPTPFQAFIGEPIVLEYDPLQLDKVLIINSASVPCCSRYALAVGFFQQSTTTSATCTSSPVQSGLMPLACTDGASVLDNVNLPPPREESLGGSSLPPVSEGQSAPLASPAPLLDQSLIDAAGASMVVQQGKVPPPREESTGGTSTSPP